MATSTSETAFLTMEKSFTYRGGREHWANSYHFDNVPPDTATWDNLAGLVWAKESAFLPADVQLERSTGHNPGTPPVLVYEKDWPPVGEGGLAGIYVPGAQDHDTPGDTAMWMRYGTTQKTSRGKPIYLRNYYHQVYVQTDGDSLSVAQRAALDSLGASMVTGFAYGGITYRRAGPRGAVAQNHASGNYPTTRTLKARGRRHRITVAQLKAAFDAGKANDVPFILGPAIDIFG